MPRSFSLLLVAAIFGGGWYFVAGPGAGKFGEYVPPATAQKAAGSGNVATNPQNTAPPALYPGGQAPFQAAPPPPVPANLAGQAALVGPPAPVGQLAPLPPQLATPTIRIASFNIQVFGDAKASKPHILWALATIIRNFHIVAIQEIRTQDDYLLTNFLRDYVNQGRAYDYILGPRLGRSTSTEQYAFVFDTAAVEVNRSSIYTVNDPDDLLHRDPLVAMFRARGPPPQEAFTFVLVNIHTDPDETASELDALGQVYQVVRQAAGGEDDIMILGDLNVDDQHLGGLGQIQGVRPIMRNVFTNARQTKLYDNIVIHQASTAEFTGRWGVYDIMRMHGLSLQQTLDVSDHLPVWAEFSAYESTGPGRFAGRATIRRQ